MSNIITSTVDEIPIKEKQVIFDTANAQILLDSNGVRVPMGGSSAAGLEDVEFTLINPPSDAYDEGIDGYIDVIQPGKRYIASNTLASLEIEAVENSSVESQIWVRFDASIIGESAPWVSFPEALGWVGEPSFENDKSYIISIQNNVAVACEYTPGA